MLKRLVGVICVRNGWAVQSIGYDRYLPIGRPEIVAENLDRWFLDEILVVCIDRTPRGLGPDYETLERVSERALMTPLTYAGGISSSEQATHLVKLGADRIALEHINNVSPETSRDIRNAVGVQAVIRTLPLEIGEDGNLWAFDYMTRETNPFDPDTLGHEHDPLFSELMIIDHKGDGGIASFNPNLLSPFATRPHQLIAFGGITTKTQVQDILALPAVSAVAVGNSLNYRELGNRDLISSSDMHDTRKTTHGEQSRGARQW